MHKISIKRTEEIIEKLKNKKIAVIGDVMLDRYFWGSVSRISPESPVPVVDVDDESFHLGGAANVASNLKSLGIDPLLCGVLGEDNSGHIFRDIASDRGINTTGLYFDTHRPTTVKTRIIGNSQHIARLDREIRSQISEDAADFIVSAIKNFSGLEGIIFEDYNKGTLTDYLIKNIIEYALEAGIPVYVDPKFTNFFEFKNVTVFKPNRKEAAQALQTEFENDEQIEAAGKELLDRLNCENVLLTLGKDGMMLFRKSGEIYRVPTRARRVADVSGAGDTAIATIAAAIAGGADIIEASALANYASGAVCEVPGIVSIEPEVLIQTIKKNNIRNKK